MRTVITRLLIAVVLATAAWLSWSESKLAAQVADARQDIATLNHDGLDALTPRAAISDYLPGDRRRLSDDVRVARATVAYWLGRYGAVVSARHGQADGHRGDVDERVIALGEQGSAHHHAEIGVHVL
jgi:hypothetical protein